MDALNLSKAQANAFCFVIMIVAASSNLIVIKIQSYQTTEIDGETYLFIHPIFQEFLIMLNGVFLVPVWYFIYSNDSNTLVIDDDKTRKREEQLNSIHRFITGFFVFGAYFLYVIALLFLSASVLQILKGFVVVILPIYSYFLFYRVLKMHETFGIFLVLVGLVLASWNEVINSDVLLLTTTGIVISFIAGFFDGGHIVYNEWTMKTYNVHPVKQITIVMLYSLMFTTIVMVAFSFIPCGEDSLICVNGHLEDPILAVREILNNSTLLWTTIILFVGVILECIFGLMTIKLDSGVSNITITQIKGLLVWMFFLVYPGQGHEEFYWLELTAFIVLLGGCALYKYNVFETRERSTYRDYEESKKLLKEEDIKI